MQGKKYDAGKTEWHWLLTGPIATACAEITRVIKFGAEKYEPNNWQLVENARTRYWNACIRHLVAWKTAHETGDENGKVDPETGISHLAHAGCNVLFLLSFDIGAVKGRFDYPAGAPVKEGDTLFISRSGFVFPVDTLGALDACQTEEDALGSETDDTELFCGAV